MVQPSSYTNDFSAGFDRGVVLSPTEFPAQLVSATGLPARVKSHVVREVVVLEVAGRLSDVAEDLDRAIQVALADAPRGVVCDLSAVLEDAAPAAVELLAMAGTHLRNWSGTPLAVVSPELRLREALVTHPLGRHLIVAASMASAVAAVLATPSPTVEWLRIAPHPTAPSVSRDFVTRILLDWGLGRLVLSAGLVVSELVARSTMVASTDIDLSVAWNLDALRLTVRDSSPDLSRPRYPQFDRHGRKLSAIAGLSRACGVLPTADGGKLVWAVLNAAWPSTSNGLSSH